MRVDLVLWGPSVGPIKLSEYIPFSNSSVKDGFSVKQSQDRPFESIGDNLDKFKESK